MDRTLVVPLEPLTTTKCFVCKNYLSVAPFAISDDGSKYKCGRCHHLKPEVSIKLTFLENFCKYFSFPCRFEGCEETVPFEEVKNHEKICQKRTIRCPVPSCDGTVMVLEIGDHFRATHQSSLFTEEFKSNLLTLPSTYVFLLMKNGDPYLIYIFLIDAVTWVSVFSLVQPMNVNMHYNLKLTGGNGLTVSFDKQLVKSLEEQEHCFRCILRQCQLPHHKYSEEYDVDFPLDSIRTSCLESDIIRKLFEDGATYSITIYNEDELAQEAALRNVKYITNNNLLRENLECPVCKEYLGAPIHICQTGHVICGRCKERLASCPTCRDNFVDSRIFALEAISQGVEIFCQYEGNGCNFIGNMRRLHEHEDECSYKV